ncbi:MAG: AAA family ATPase, partial [Acidimicrobiales bacterium]
MSRLDASDTGLIEVPGQRDFALVPGARPVRISSISVDGFGVLSGAEIRDLGPGVSVVLGRNEVGKSTLFDFVNAILFGFPSRKDNAHYRPPLAGGRHGGRLTIVDGDERAWTIERHASPAKRLTITAGDGSVGDDGDLQRLLGRASSELFRTVFAVDLDDLRQVGNMASAEVREVLFSSSMLGQRRSAARAMKELQERRDLLARPRQDARANQLDRQLAEARSRLSSARQRTAQFEFVRSEADRLSEEVESRKKAAEACRERTHELRLLKQCWVVLSDKRELEAKLERLPPLDRSGERLLASAERLQELRQGWSGHVVGLDELATRRYQQAGLIQSIETRAASLGPEAARTVADGSFDAEVMHEEAGLLKADLLAAEQAVGQAGVLLDRATEASREIEGAAETPTRGLR